MSKWTPPASLEEGRWTSCLYTYGCNTHIPVPPTLTLHPAPSDTINHTPPLTLTLHSSPSPLILTPHPHPSSSPSHFTPHPHTASLTITRTFHLHCTPRPKTAPITSSSPCTHHPLTSPSPSPSHCTHQHHPQQLTPRKHLDRQVGTLLLH